MSRARLHLGKGAVGVSGLSLVDQPQMSGIPRENESASIWAGSYSGGTPTNYRFKLYRDGVLVTTVTQATEEYTFNWASADAGTVTTATVEASANSGVAWTAPVEPYYSFFPDTQLIEPAIITPDLTLTRTSSANVTPVTFNITGTIYPSYVWEVVKLNSDFLTETYRGRKPVTEYEIANLTLDLDGVTGPALDPPMSALGATEILKVRLVTEDWNENGVNPGDNSGLAGRWVAVSATNFGGNQFYKLAIASTPSGVGGGIVMVAVELAESIGGANLVRDMNYSYSSGDEIISPVGGTTYQSDHIFDGVASTYGALNTAPASIVIDALVPRPFVRLRITSTVNNFQQAPAAFTFGPCLADGTYIGTPLSVSGLTWSSSADETKQWSF